MALRSSTLVFLSMFAVLGCDRGTLIVYDFDYELRVPRTAVPDPETQFQVVSENNISGTMLPSAKHRTEDEFDVYAHLVMLDSDQHRRAMVVMPKGRAAQVFVLPLPSKPTAADWTEWRRPDYMEEGAADREANWTFMNGLDAPRSTKIPSDCFQLRYRIGPGRVVEMIK